MRSTSYFYKTFLKKIKKQKEIYKKVRAEKYLLCMLDQDANAQGALVSISPKNGDIISFVGGKTLRSLSSIEPFNRKDNQVHLLSPFYLQQL